MLRQQGVVGLGKMLGRCAGRSDKEKTLDGVCAETKACVELQSEEDYGASVKT